MVRLRFNTEKPPFGNPQRKYVDIARVLRVPVQTCKDIIKRATLSLPVDRRKSHPRTHPQLTKDIIDMITDWDLLESWKNLNLRER